MLLRIRQVLLVDGDDDRDTVVDDDHAVAIEDAAARRLLEDRARLERLGRVLELLLAITCRYQKPRRARRTAMTITMPRIPNRRRGFSGFIREPTGRCG